MVTLWAISLAAVVLPAGAPEAHAPGRSRLDGHRVGMGRRASTRRAGPGWRRGGRGWTARGGSETRRGGTVAGRSGYGDGPGLVVGRAIEEGRAGAAAREPGWWVLARRAYARPPVLLVDGYVPPPALQDRPGYWNGVPDEVLLRRIQTRRILRVTVNRGGSSVSLRLHMEGGVSAAFKPDQIYKQSIPRKEIAAYVINRLLGFARVPPATYRVVPVRELFAKLEAARWRRRWLRRAILPDAHGNLAGEVSYWIPRLAHLPL